MEKGVSGKEEKKVFKCPRFPHVLVRQVKG